MEADQDPLPECERGLGLQPDKALEWVEATMARLFWGEIAGVIWGLQRMQPCNQEAATQIKKGLGYLENNKERMDYGSLRKGGIPWEAGGLNRRILPCAPQTLWGLVVCGQWEQDAGVTLCQIQGHVQPHL